MEKTIELRKSYVQYVKYKAINQLLGKSEKAKQRAKDFSIEKIVQEWKEILR